MSKAAQALPTSPAIPDGAVFLASSSGNVANASGVATLVAPAGKTVYLTEFTVTGGGATAAGVVTITVTGLVGGTQSYTYGAPAGAGASALPLYVDFATPVPATGPGVNVVVTVPAVGAGNTNTTVVATGYAV